MPSPWQVVGEVAGVGILVCLAVLLERSEKISNALNIEPGVWKLGKKKVAKRMDQKGEWWRRLLRKWNAAGRLGNQKVNEGAKR